MGNIVASGSVTEIHDMPKYGESVVKAAEINKSQAVEVAKINASNALAQWGIKEALALALAVKQYASYDKAIDKQDKIAQRIQDRADELHSIWKNSYLECELKTAAEICAEPKVEPQSILASIKANAEISKQFSIAKQNALYCIDSQCHGSRCDTERKFAIAQSRSSAWQVNASINQEIARADLKNAQRLNNRILMLNAGRNGVANASSALAQASQIYQQQSQAAAAGFNGAMATLGRLTQDTVNANRTPMQNVQMRSSPVTASGNSPNVGKEAIDQWYDWAPPQNTNANGTANNLIGSNSVGSPYGTMSPDIIAPESDSWDIITARRGGQQQNKRLLLDPVENISQSDVDYSNINGPI